MLLESTSDAQSADKERDTHGRQEPRTKHSGTPDHREDGVEQK